MVKEMTDTLVMKIALNNCLVKLITKGRICFLFLLFLFITFYFDTCYSIMLLFVSCFSLLNFIAMPDSTPTQ